MTDSPDRSEEDVSDQLDDAVPSFGYELQPVVGLGGSAGAVPAIITFLRALPPRSGYAYVVILHLSPEFESNMAEVLAPHTTMPVLRVTGTMKVVPDTVYVIPPGHALHMFDGELQLGELPRDVPGRVAVDLFFRSLADTHGPHAVAIVLSGMDGDGAIGIKRVKERGGLTIAQDPDEAQHGGMPHSAIATGMVDWVLPVAQMPGRLARYMALEHDVHLPPERETPESTSSSDESDLRELLGFLRTRTGRDFSNYKRATVLRRIGRRMQVNGVEKLSDYVECLRTRPGEAAALLQDLLISVTNFFRDSDCFDALRQHVPALFQDKSPNDTVRVWIAACATGEEAYSIAMLLSEHARTLEAPPLIQVFATDLDEEAIRVAREGVYPTTIEADVSEERLRRFFVKDMRGYRIRRELREQVLFAPHDILKDSPFSRLDLFSCRNLLIYLTREAQRRVLDTAHFALLANGRMFLGASETVDDNSPLFFTLDKKHRIFAPRPSPRTALPVPVGRSVISRVLDLGADKPTGPVLPGAAFSATPPAAHITPAADSRSASWGDLHMRMRESLAPPSIVIDAEQEVMHVSPNAGRFLQVAEGEPTRNLLRLVSPSLRIELRTAIFKSLQTSERVDVPRLAIDLSGQPAQVEMSVLPMDGIAPGTMLVTFRVAPVDRGESVVQSDAEPGSGDPLAQLLDRELERLKSHLRDTVEQYEASTEELKASNEELQAMNEELRSATEELETSREELQSINEELTTVNHELKTKVDELGTANSDMQNLIDATAIATVFLDRDLRVTRFTPAAIRLFNLIPTDIGRPLSHLASNLEYAELDADARRVLQTLVPQEREVNDRDQSWFLARMRPYRTSEDRIAGVVLTLVDTTERKRAEERLRLSEERFGAIANKASIGVLQSTLDGKVTFANRYFSDLLGYREGDLQNIGLLDLVHPDERAEAERKFATLREVGHFEVEKRLQCRTGATLWVHNSVSLLPSEDAAGSALIVSTDITERKRAEDALRASEERMRLIVSNATEYGIFALDRQRRVTYWSVGAQRLLGFREDEILGQSADLIFTDEDRLALAPEQEMRMALGEGCALDERVHVRKGGERFWASGALMAMRDARGETVGFVKIMRDQTSAREAQLELTESRAQVIRSLEENERARRDLEQADIAKDRFLAVLSHELRNPLAGIAGAAEAMASASATTPVDRGRAQEVLRNQVIAMRNLIDDLLDVSRLRLGRFVLHKRYAALSSVLDVAIESARPTIERRHHALTVTLPPAPIMLHVDPGRLQQVFTNLLINAAKYTDERGRIALRARVEDGRCIVEIEDNGRGLDERTIESMFEMFWRSDLSDPTGSHSMGIGLTLSRSILELHDCTIVARSPGLGQGSTFTVTLPLPRPDELPPDEPAPEPGAAPRPAPSERAHPFRVLVTDDLEDAAWTLATVLETRGFQVRTAFDGRQALTMLDDFRPDVAVLDVGMPGMTGHELAQRIRATPRGADMLIVAATGWGSEDDRAATRDAGFDAHLVKPIVVDDLVRLIEERAPRRAGQD